MFKLGTTAAHPVADEMPPHLRDTDPATVWPPAIAHQVPLTPKKKPIFKEPVAQGIILLSGIVPPALEYLRVPHEVFVSSVCFSMILDVLLVTLLVWKAERAKQKTRE